MGAIRFRFENVWLDTREQALKIVEYMRNQGKDFRLEDLMYEVKK